MYVYIYIYHMSMNFHGSFRNFFDYVVQNMRTCGYWSAILDATLRCFSLWHWRLHTAPFGTVFWVKIWFQPGNDEVLFLPYVMKRHQSWFLATKWGCLAYDSTSSQLESSMTLQRSNSPQAQMAKHHWHYDTETVWMLPLQSGLRLPTTNRWHCWGIDTQNSHWKIIINQAILDSPIFRHTRPRSVFGAAIWK